MVKASEFKNVCKAVNDRKLAELKKEIIEILKKQDEKDVKKAIDYFNSQEEHYTHLEKSLISGKWIRKAGYGVGTVRIWKGKKYKKIAPGKWARVFDKEGRGTNIAIGKLIAKVQKIDNIEDLMAFVMQNKQRFVDENGIDLPVLDKLRAAVDAKNNGGIGSKTTSKPAEKKEDNSRYVEMAKEKIKQYAGKEINSNEISDIKILDDGERSGFLTFEFKSGNDKYKMTYDSGFGGEKGGVSIKKVESEESGADKPSKKEEKQYKETKKMLEDKIAEFDKQLKMFDNNPNENTKRLSKDIEKQKKTYVKMLENLESEYEKTQNRSEAMKGNKNAYKGVAELEKMSPDSLQEYVDEMHNKIMKMDHEDKGLHDAIETWKNAERIRKEKLHAAHELRSDFETKLLNSLQDGIEKQKEACENWNIAEMSDNQLSEYIKVADKWKDKGLVHLADPIIDKWVDSGKDTYDNNDFVGPAMDYQGFAIAHSKAYDKMKKELESRKKAKDEENKPEKTVEETKETPKEEKTEKIYSIDNSGKVVSFDELQPIASNKSVGENEVQLPYSKDLANEIESLKNCAASKYDPRETFRHIFYKDGKLITTDARRMKFVEVGELEGIPDGSYVDINTDKSGINIKKTDFNAQFPNYSKVVPDNLNQTATLDTKLVKDKIKEMYKDGAISKKGSNLVQLEFRDGKVFIDDTPVGEAKDIKMKYSDNWGPARNDTNYMTINADYFVNALSGKKSVLQIGERADKAVAINTGSSSNILMPMSGSDKKMDYGKGRKEKQEANDKKSALKAAYKKANEDYIASIKENYGERFKRIAQSAADNLTERMADMNDETLKLNYDRLKFNLDKVMDKKEYITEDTKVDNKLKLGLRDAILYQTTAKEHPEVIERFEEELEKRGITVKKSLFDDFVMDMFIDEDEEEIEEDEENESLFNDYSAEQPELFNSTEMKVQEAFNRCGCCL